MPLLNNAITNWQVDSISFSPCRIRQSIAAESYVCVRCTAAILWLLEHAEVSAEKCVWTYFITFTQCSSSKTIKPLTSVSHPQYCNVYNKMNVNTCGPYGKYHIICIDLHLSVQMRTDVWRLGHPSVTAWSCWLCRYTCTAMAPFSLSLLCTGWAATAVHIHLSIHCQESVDSCCWNMVYACNCSCEGSLKIVLVEAGRILLKCTAMHIRWK